MSVTLPIMNTPTGEPQPVKESLLRIASHLDRLAMLKRELLNGSDACERAVQQFETDKTGFLELEQLLSKREKALDGVEAELQARAAILTRQAEENARQARGIKHEQSEWEQRFVALERCEAMLAQFEQRFHAMTDQLQFTSSNENNS